MPHLLFPPDPHPLSVQSVLYDAHPWGLLPFPGQCIWHYPFLPAGVQLLLHVRFWVKCSVHCEEFSDLNILSFWLHPWSVYCACQVSDNCWSVLMACFSFFLNLLSSSEPFTIHHAILFFFLVCVEFVLILFIVNCRVKLYLMLWLQLVIILIWSNEHYNCQLPILMTYYFWFHCRWNQHANEKVCHPLNTLSVWGW